MSLARRLKLATAVVVVVAAGIVFLLQTAPARADSIQYLDGGYAQVTDNNHTIQACDTNADNRGVYAAYDWRAPDGSHGENVQVRDTTGSADGCGQNTLRKGQITRYHVCLRKPGSAETDYCKPWMRV